MMNSELIAGDTLDFLDSVPEYPPADGWSLKYRLIPRFTSPPQAAIDITASTSGSDYRVQVASGVTATWPAGAYTWSRWVEKAGPIRQSLGDGQLTVKANLAAAAQGYDGRSQAAKAVDDIKAAMATFTASNGTIKSYSIGNRQVTYRDKAEMITDLDFWQRQLVAEQDAAKIAAGMNPRNAGIRFSRI
ncbi:MAG TPA: hypothetical protein VJT81_06615 [Burkholderiales bacterium]|nr:hypothetical protein [Burkholderiales bacterium]